MITAWSFSLKSRRSSKFCRTSGSGSGSQKVGPGHSGLRSIKTDGKPLGLSACRRSRTGDLDLERSRSLLARTVPPLVGLVPGVGVEPTAGARKDLVELE